MSDNLEILKLKPEKIHIENILLDPNNPRLISTWNEHVPDDKIPNDRVQKMINDSIIKIGIKDLTEKIQRQGFLVIDRVVVRPIGEDKYVVVEGNRRIAAVKYLLDPQNKIILSVEIRVICVFHSK